MLAGVSGFEVRFGMVLPLSFPPSLTFALPVSFPAVRRRILNAINAGSGEKAWVKTLPLV